MIKNVILDMGNVLINYNPQIVLDICCDSEAEKTVIRKELFGGQEWVWGDEGRIKDCELYDLVKQHVPQEYWTALKKCCDQWDICMQPIDGAKEFCEYVKSHGYHIYVLSNANDRFYQYFDRLLPLDFFDGVVVSCDVRMIKPDERIYRHILDKYNMDALECLFIDDRPDNVNAAKAVGMHTYQFRNNYEEMIQKFLKSNH